MVGGCVGAWLEHVGATAMVIPNWVNRCILLAFVLQHVAQDMINNNVVL
jgi:hypothetical protein